VIRGGRVAQARLALDAETIRIPDVDPHLVLGCCGAIVLVAEFAAIKQGSSGWILVSAIAAAVALVVAWQWQDRLRLWPLLGLALAFQLGWIALHLSLGVHSFDSSRLYRVWGNELLHGHYPDAQYPPAAVLLFAFDAFVGGGATSTPHAFAMVPFQLMIVAAVWELRAPRSAWFTALVALWPLNAFSWEYRFDLFPTALLALGLLYARRRQWALSGALLGLGAAAKWTPALAAAVLGVWLLAGRRWRSAWAMTLTFALAFVLLHLPFLLWNPHAVLYSYRYFGSQSVTGESIWYLVLAPFGQASVPAHAFWLPAHVPGWTNAATTIVQAGVLLALGVLAWRVRSSARAGVAVAAMAPVIFLLLNRVFSPQYLVLMLVAWAIAGALIVRNRLEQLGLGAAIMLSTTANALVYPYTAYQLGLWRLASAVLFAVGLATTIWILVKAAAATRRVEHEERRRFPSIPVEAR
jgi:hypothetical protein